MNKLRGCWRLAEATTAGQPFQESNGFMEVYEKGSFWRDWRGMQSISFRYQTYETEEVGVFQIDQFTEDESGVLRGLFKFEGGKLVMCFADEVGLERPTHFASDESNGWNLSVWEPCAEVPVRKVVE